MTKQDHERNCPDDLMPRAPHVSRRALLAAGIGGVGALALGRRAAPLLALGGAAQDQDDVLIIVQLSGGNDGLNTVAPVGDPAYKRARPRIGLAQKDVLPLASGLGLHPSLKAMHELFGQKQLAVIQGVGYPNPNRSHFKSMDIWHAADPSARDMRYGWLGRALDQMAKGSSLPELGVNLSEEVPLALNGASYKPVSFQNAAAYSYVGEAAEKPAFEKISNAESKAGNPLLARLRRVAKDAHASSERVRKLARSYKTQVRYPGGPFAASLRQVAALLAGGLGTRVYYTYHNGFDTHVNQAGRHANLLRQFDESIRAFWKDLQRSQLEQRVTVMVFSEFGRRVRENGSGGTDHGVAGTSFVFGGRVRGGLYGESPSLTDTDNGDLKHNIDFRSIYASLCEDVLRVDSKKVLGQEQRKLSLLG
jgi:uncharacterized protein (DUF1501 family)